jgi:monoamine oxidase
MLTEYTADKKWYFDMWPSWFWPWNHRIQELIETLGREYFPQHEDLPWIFQGYDGQVTPIPAENFMIGGYRVVWGFWELINKLRDTIPEENISYNSLVTIVDFTDGTYRVTLSDGTIWQAKKIVFAIPPRVITETIEFTPNCNDALMWELRRIPTWMGSFAKIFFVYQTPFWRNNQLSGNGMSRKWPLRQFHDASPKDLSYGGLFGFISIPYADRLRLGSDWIIEASKKQFAEMFWEAALEPLHVFLKDWTQDVLTAGEEDRAFPYGHPNYGYPLHAKNLCNDTMVFSSTEMGHTNGGYIEWALEASEYVLKWV